MLKNIALMFVLLLTPATVFAQDAENVAIAPVAVVDESTPPQPVAAGAVAMVNQGCTNCGQAATAVSMGCGSCDTGCDNGCAQRAPRRRILTALKSNKGDCCTPAPVADCGCQTVSCARPVRTGCNSCGTSAPVYSTPVSAGCGCSALVATPVQSYVAAPSGCGVQQVSYDAPADCDTSARPRLRLFSGSVLRNRR